MNDAARPYAVLLTVHHRSSQPTAEGSAPRPSTVWTAVPATSASRPATAAPAINADSQDFVAGPTQARNRAPPTARMMQIDWTIPTTRAPGDSCGIAADRCRPPAARQRRPRTKPFRRPMTIVRYHTPTDDVGPVLIACGQPDDHDSAAYGDVGQPNDIAFRLQHPHDERCDAGGEPQFHLLHRCREGAPSAVRWPRAACGRSSAAHCAD